MRVLALDISTNTGWAVLDGDKGQQPQPQVFGNCGLLADNLNGYARQVYPFNYLYAASDLAKQFAALYIQHIPDIIVIEEINRSSRHTSRYSTRILEWIHCFTASEWAKLGVTPTYVSTSVWRKAAGIEFTKADKRNNAKVAQAKRTGKDKKALGIKGKLTKKHLAVRRVYELYNLNLKQKDNDIAEAILLGYSWFMGIQPCDGII